GGIMVISISEADEARNKIIGRDLNRVDNIEKEIDKELRVALEKTISNKIEIFLSAPTPSYGSEPAYPQHMIQEIQRRYQSTGWKEVTYRYDFYPGLRGEERDTESAAHEFTFVRQ
ncbi:MAG: hypothetical protein KJO08_07905, partial [Gammaproteobacteria bacterium]|nr:hypothetical protein [Gammaproteobacteria bacterium]